jgi:hypothetical protein
MLCQDIHLERFLLLFLEFSLFFVITLIALTQAENKRKRKRSFVPRNASYLLVREETFVDNLHNGQVFASVRHP